MKSYIRIPNSLPSAYASRRVAKKANANGQK